MPIAFNSETDSAVFLDQDGGWKPAPIAKNSATGERMAYDGNNWMPLKTPTITDTKPSSATSFSDMLTPILPTGANLPEIPPMLGKVGSAISERFTNPPQELSVIGSLGHAFKALNDLGQFAKGPGAKSREELLPVIGQATDLASTIGFLPSAGGASRVIQGVKSLKTPIVPQSSDIPQFSRPESPQVVPPTVPQAAPSVLSPISQTPRPANLLPPDVPHLLPPEQAASLGARRSMGAGGDPLGPLADISPDTRNMIADVIKNEGFNVHTVEQRLSEMSPHDFLGELTPNTSLHMSGLQTHVGQARNEITSSVLQRQREAPERMTAAFDAAFGQAQNRAELMRSMTKQRAEDSGPFWKTFRETIIPPTPALTELMPRLRAAGALQAANKAMAEKGLPAENKFILTESGPIKANSNITTGGKKVETTSVPSASAFQYAKEHLDTLIEKNMAQPGGEGAVARYVELKNALVNAIDNHPDQRVAGIWKDARNKYAQPTSIMKASKLGERILTGNVRSDELPILLETLSPAERSALNIGIRGRLEDLAGKPGKTERTVINTILAPSNAAKITAVIGEEKAAPLLAAIDHEARIHNAPNSLIYNSMTEPRRRAADFWAPKPGMFETASLSDVPHGMVHGLGMLAKAGIKKVQGDFGKQKASEFAKIRDEAARIFTLQGPERDAVIRYFVNGQ